MCKCSSANKPSIHRVAFFDDECVRCVIEKNVMFSMSVRNVGTEFCTVIICPLHCFSLFKSSSF